MKTQQNVTLRQLDLSPQFYCSFRCYWGWRFKTPTREISALHLFDENKVTEKKNQQCIKFYPATTTTTNLKSEEGMIFLQSSKL